MLLVEQNEFQFSVYDFGAGTMKAAGERAGINFRVDVGEAQPG